MSNSRTESTVRGLLVFGAMWQALWLAADSALRRTLLADPTDPAMLLVLASMVLWVGILVALYSPIRDTRLANRLQVAAMVALAMAGLLLMLDTRAGDNGWYVGASVLNLAAGLAGLALSRRTGLIVVFALVSFEAVVVSVVHLAGADQESLAVDLIYPLYALALGLASVGGRFALVRSARAEDASVAALARQRSARAQSEFTDAAISAAETRLHESVLNTLTAIVRGGLGDDPATTARLRERAAEAAGVLRMIADGADTSVLWNGDLRIDLAGAVADLQNAGFTVTLSGVLDTESLVGGVDDESYGAVATATREALINAGRHSKAGKVAIHGDVTDEEGERLWTVRVRDDGVGLIEPNDGYGLRVIVREGVASVGGRASIRTLRRGGTEVRIALPIEPTAGRRVKLPVTPVRAVGWPVVSAFSVFTMFTIAVTWSYAREPVANGVATAVFLAVATLLFAVTRFGGYERMPWWVAVVTVVAVPLLTAVEARADAIANPTGDWSSEVGAAFLFVVVATGAWWVGPLAIIAWFIAQESQFIEFLQPGTIVIVVAMVMAWQLRRMQSHTASFNVEVDDQRAALAQSQVKLANARQRHADVDTSALIGVLDQIAAGDVDPSDPTVVNLCVREERLIRSVLRLHPEFIRMHGDLIALASRARDLGVELSIAASVDVPGDRNLAARDRALQLLSLAQAGSSARVMVSSHSGECVFRLVVEVPSERIESAAAMGEVLDEDAGMVVIEEIWELSSREVIADRTPSAHGT